MDYIKESMQVYTEKTETLVQLKVLLFVAFKNIHFYQIKIFI